MAYLVTVQSESTVDGGNFTKVINGADKYQVREKANNVVMIEFWRAEAEMLFACPFNRLICMEAVAMPEVPNDQA